MLVLVGVAVFMGEGWWRRSGGGRSRDRKRGLKEGDTEVPGQEEDDENLPDAKDEHAQVVLKQEKAAMFGLVSLAVYVVVGMSMVMRAAVVTAHGEEGSGRSIRGRAFQRCLALPHKRPACEIQGMSSPLIGPPRSQAPLKGTVAEEGGHGPQPQVEGEEVGAKRRGCGGGEEEELVHAIERTARSWMERGKKRMLGGWRWPVCLRRKRIRMGGIRAGEGNEGGRGEEVTWRGWTSKAYFRALKYTRRTTLVVVVDRSKSKTRLWTRCLAQQTRRRSQKRRVAARSWRGGRPLAQQSSLLDLLLFRMTSLPSTLSTLTTSLLPCPR